MLHRLRSKPGWLAAAGGLLGLMFVAKASRHGRRRHGRRSSTTRLGT